MKSPKPPAPAPVPPPVSATSVDSTAAGYEAQRKQKNNYDWGKTILRPGGLSAMPPGTSATLGK